MIRNRADSIAAYDRFIRRLSGGGAVWLIVDTAQDLPATCASNDDETVLVVPVWSDRAYAERVQSRFGAGTQVEQVPLENFLTRTLPYLSDRRMRVGPNWNGDLAGLEVDPKDVGDRLQGDSAGPAA